MTAVELHNLLLQRVLEEGDYKLREDFVFEDLLPDEPCNYCVDASKLIMETYDDTGFISAKYCPNCGRKLDV